MDNTVALGRIAMGCVPVQSRSCQLLTVKCSKIKTNRFARFFFPSCLPFGGARLELRMQRCTSFQSAPLREIYLFTLSLNVGRSLSTFCGLPDMDNLTAMQWIPHSTSINNARNFERGKETVRTFRCDLKIGQTRLHYKVLRRKKISRRMY